MISIRIDLDDDEGFVARRVRDDGFGLVIHEEPFAKANSWPEISDLVEVGFQQFGMFDNS